MIESDFRSQKSTLRSVIGQNTVRTGSRFGQNTENSRFSGSHFRVYGLFQHCLASFRLCPMYPVLRFFHCLSAGYPPACWGEESGPVRNIVRGVSLSRNAPQLAVGYFTFIHSIKRGDTKPAPSACLLRLSTNLSEMRHIALPRLH